MRIGVLAPSPVPYVRGGYERLCTGLVNHINERTEHQAELFKFPFPESNLAEVIDGYRRFSALGDLGVDVVVTGKYPAWCVDHPHQVVYMAHRLRGLYDAYPGHLGLAAPPEAEADRTWFDLDDPDRSLDEIFDRLDALVDRLGWDHPAFAYPGPLARAAVHALDRVALAPGRIRRYVAISATVARRPDYFPAGAQVAVAHTPSNLATIPAQDDRDGFFTASRLDQPKRLELLIAAMRHVTSNVPLRIAGTGPAEAQLRALAADDPRVQFLGFQSEDQLAQHYSRAIAVPFVPHDEDLGLITVEAMATGIPVVTTWDSGGPAEIVQDGVTGIVTDPIPDAVGQVLGHLAVTPELVNYLGANACEAAAQITWGRVMSRLLGTTTPTPVASQPRTGAREHKPLLLVLSTYAVHPAHFGGALRCTHLYGGLTDVFEVRILSLVEHHLRPRTVKTPNGLVEIQIPRVPEHGTLDWTLSGEVGIPMSDLYGGQFVGLTPAYLDALRAGDGEAAAVLLAHPYMLPSLELVSSSTPIIYDAHNVETQLKSALLPNTIAGDRVRMAVAAVERQAVRSASLLSICSTADLVELNRVYGPLPATHIARNGVDVTGTRFVPPSDRPALRARWRERWAARAGQEEVAEQIAVFIGSPHPPNLEAARIVHGIAADRPDVTFLMVGGHTFDFRDASLPQNVIQLGEVSDHTKAQVLHVASVALNPMTTGSGTNLKLVEYLAAGVPTVSTRLGALGVLDDREDELCFLAEAGTFADAVAEILRRRPEDLDEISIRGRRLVEQEFDWRQISRSLACAMVDVLDLGRWAVVE